MKITGPCAQASENFANDFLDQRDRLSNRSILTFLKGSDSTDIQNTAQRLYDSNSTEDLRALFLNVYLTSITETNNLAKIMPIYDGARGYEPNRNITIKSETRENVRNLIEKKYQKSEQTKQPKPIPGRPQSPTSVTDVGIDPEQPKETAKSTPGRGIYNPSNNCFMNAGINYVKHSGLIDKEPIKAPLSSFLEAEKKGESNSPIHLPDNFRTELAEKKLVEFESIREQEDADEFIMKLIGKVDSNAPDNNDIAVTSLSRVVVSNLKTGTSEERDLGCSEKEAFLKLDLPPKQQRQDLHGIFDFYYLHKKEPENEGYLNENENEHGDLLKIEERWMVEPDQYPSSLHFSLKRFNGSLTGGGSFSSLKRNDKIDMPLTFKRKNQTFELNCFIKHRGPTPRSGHYTEYAKQNGKWYCYNDGEVTEVTQDHAQAEASKSYIFNYKEIKAE